MPSWKKILLRSVGFGAGFSVMLSVIVGGWIWYSERPKPPKAWNKRAIVAEFDYVRPVGDKNNLTFYYTLQNNTDFDYRLDSNAGVEITAKLQQEKGFGEFGAKIVTTAYPVFVPTRSRVRFVLNVDSAYPVREKNDPTDEERKQFTTDVSKYVTDHFDNLDGFALFDTANRYEIDFPTGWEERAKRKVPVK